MRLCHLSRRLQRSLFSRTFGLLLSLLGPLLGRPIGCRGDVVTIGLDHHTLFHRHGDGETILILHQDDVLALESLYDAAANLAEEADFISNIHSFSIYLWPQSYKSLRTLDDFCPFLCMFAA